MGGMGQDDKPSDERLGIVGHVSPAPWISKQASKCVAPDAPITAEQARELRDASRRDKLEAELAPIYREVREAAAAGEDECKVRLYSTLSEQALLALTGNSNPFKVSLLATLEMRPPQYEYRISWRGRNI